MLGFEICNYRRVLLFRTRREVVAVKTEECGDWVASRPSLFPTPRWFGAARAGKSSPRGNAKKECSDSHVYATTRTAKLDRSRIRNA